MLASNPVTTTVKPIISATRPIWRYGFSWDNTSRYFDSRTGMVALLFPQRQEMLQDGIQLGIQSRFDNALFCMNDAPRPLDVRIGRHFQRLPRHVQRQFPTQGFGR